ncbi:MAG: hypothetical protein AMJ88_02930 [Anaerolineae bacterium SM23_ 63]|nr:MAG: hypothetical protein AMJ88_02930 [Anaerolineae bacterium SM23_ 63]HEY46976.1 flippase-like domain-containing protein [Anaerolineae bacterium]
MRKIIYVLLILLTIYYVSTHYEELKQVLEVFGEGDGRWLWAAVGIQILWMVNIAAAFQACYAVMGVKVRLVRLVILTSAAIFVNVVVPTYGVGTVAVLVTDGYRRGRPAGKVWTAVFLYTLFDYLGFMVVLLPAMIILDQLGAMNIVFITAGIFAAAVAVVLVAMALLGIWSEMKLVGTVSTVVPLVNKSLRPFLRRELIDPQRAKTFVREISEGLMLIRRSPKYLLGPAALALSRKLLMIMILYMVSRAFHHPLSLGVLIATFGISYLFSVASLTPSGVGIVEGAMVITLVALDIPLPTAVAIALAYRGITLWLRLAYGGLALLWFGYTPSQPIRADAVIGNPSMESNPHNFQDTDNA